MRFPKLGRQSWITIGGGVAIIVCAVALGISPDYSWWYALWFGWVGPVLILVGLSVRTEDSGTETNDPEMNE